MAHNGFQAMSRQKSAEEQKRELLPELSNRSLIVAFCVLAAVGLYTLVTQLT